MCTSHGRPAYHSLHLPVLSALRVRFASHPFIPPPPPFPPVLSDGRRIANVPVNQDESLDAASAGAEAVGAWDHPTATTLHAGDVLHFVYQVRGWGRGGGGGAGMSCMLACHAE
jgi:hypothetical protein